VEVKPRPHFTFDVTGFYKELWNLVSKTDRVTVDQNGLSHPLVYDNAGRGWVYGVELLVRHELTEHFSGWLAYTLSRSQRRDSGQTDRRPFDFDQPHILTAVATYLLPRNWQVGGRFRLVSGTPITPVVGAVANVTSDRYDPTYGPTNADRIAPFHQLDLRIDKRWIYKAWMLNAYLDIQNIYNRANPEGVTYNYDYRKSTVKQGLPIFPIVGLRADF
jgi:hypothetical protein